MHAAEIQPILRSFRQLVSHRILACWRRVTLRARRRGQAPGLTPRAGLEKFAAPQMLDVHFPTTDGRELSCIRSTQPVSEQQLLLEQLGWSLPAQPPPKITAKREVQRLSRLFASPA